MFGWGHESKIYILNYVFQHLVYTLNLISPNKMLSQVLVEICFFNNLCGKNGRFISQIVRTSEVCDLSGGRVSKNDKSCHTCWMRLNKDFSLNRKNMGLCLRINIFLIDIFNRIQMTSEAVLPSIILPLGSGLASPGLKTCGCNFCKSKQRFVAALFDFLGETFIVHFMGTRVSCSLC